MKINHKNFFHKRYMGIDPYYDIPMSICGYVWRFITKTALYLFGLQLIISPFIWFFSTKKFPWIDVIAFHPYLQLCAVMTSGCIIGTIVAILGISCMMMVSLANNIKWPKIDCGNIELKDHD